jgi:hypothetical protein
MKKEVKAKMVIVNGSRDELKEAEVQAIDNLAEISNRHSGLPSHLISWGQRKKLEPASSLKNLELTRAVWEGSP